MSKTIGLDIVIKDTNVNWLTYLKNSTIANDHNIDSNKELGLLAVTKKFIHQEAQ